MDDVFITRDHHFLPGMNTGFVTSCARLIINSVISSKRPPELNEYAYILWEVSVSLVDNEWIQNINRNYRSIDEPTDVISFPQNDPEELEEYLNTAVPSGKLVLGDIVVSLEWISKETNGEADLVRRSFAWMMTHGILHLFGYEHDNKANEKIMRDYEAKILLELEDFVNNVAK